jgi:hypothetical protein
MLVMVGAAPDNIRAHNSFLGFYQNCPALGNFLQIGSCSLMYKGNGSRQVYP